MTAAVTEYDGFLTTGAATLAPSLRYDARAFSFATQTSWTVFESGNSILQGSGAAAWLSPARGRARLELGATGGAFRYAAERASGHALGRARLHLSGARSGGWLAAAAGASFDSTTRAPFQFGGGWWTVRNRFSAVTTVSTTWLGADRHVDLSGTARWTLPRMILETRAGLRPYAQSAGRVGDAFATAWGEVAALIPLRSSVALDLSGGSYPTDPVRRVLGAKYVNAGLRIDFGRREQLPALTVPPAILAALENHRAEASPEARLEIEGQTLRVLAPGARAVEIMGDFTDWKEIALAHRGSGVWEAALQIAPGVHRLNLRVNGGAWLVPLGTRPEEGEFGDKVGVIVVR